MVMRGSRDVRCPNPLCHTRLPSRVRFAPTFRFCPTCRTALRNDWAWGALLCALLALAPALRGWAGLAVVLGGLLGGRRARPAAGRGQWVARVAVGLGTLMVGTAILPLGVSWFEERHQAKEARPPVEEAQQQAAQPRPAGESPPRATAWVEDGTFGSQALLKRLWTPQDLQGSPQDRQIVRLSVPDRRPPSRIVPTRLAPPLPPALLNSIRRVEPWHNRKVVALTFNLGERADEVTGLEAPIVNYLRAEKVRATFFAGGKWMRSHPEKAMQLMADPLFEVGNHSWTHGNLRLLTGQRLADQILWTQAQYQLLWEELAARARQQGIDEREIAPIPSVPRTFRFPYGTCSPEALRAVADAGLVAIQWDVVGSDPAKPQTAQSIVTTVMRQTRPGSIVVLHANGHGHGTTEALPHIISGLRARGFEFVTVNELLQLGTVMATGECYELRPGDNRRYDALVEEGTSS